MKRSRDVARKDKSSKQQKKSSRKPQRRAKKRGRSPELADHGPRDRMVAGAATLLAQRGLQATSFSEVLELTNSPRGSVYHHFPGGKDQLVKAALEWVTAQFGRVLSPREGASPEEVTDLFLSIWRGILTRSQFKAGCAVVAVTVAADSPGLLEHAASIFRAWRQRLASYLLAGGVVDKDAARFAALLIAASEGAVILSRGEKSLDAFDLVASQLVEQARALPRRNKR